VNKDIYNALKEFSYDDRREKRLRELIEYTKTRSKEYREGRGDTFEDKSISVYHYSDAYKDLMDLIKNL